jgi:hypothetical protein
MPYVNEVSIKDWAAFEGEANRTLEDFQRRRAAGNGYQSHPLFRGQSDQRWSLVTTLERFSTKEWSVKSYYKILLSVAPAVASLTSRVWDLGRDLDVDESHHGPPPSYEFMIYLRHHGFPSPLLDWSRSPYVAAFFAFAPRPQPDCEAAAIFAFREHVGHGKTWSGDGARIIGLGPYTVTHERHYSQQCEYTICKKRVGDSYLYCNHEEALHDRVVPQDLLTKYVIPVTERNRFLRKLESMNIHAYSLFRDESSLMQTLAYREIEKDDL